MELHLTPSWKLSTEHAMSSYGIPVLINCATGDAFGPRDIVRPYPSWDFASAAAAVRRMANMAELSADDTRFLERFLEAQ